MKLEEEKMKLQNQQREFNLQQILFDKRRLNWQKKEKKEEETSLAFEQEEEVQQEEEEGVEEQQTVLPPQQTVEVIKTVAALPYAGVTPPVNLELLKLEQKLQKMQDDANEMHEFLVDESLAKENYTASTIHTNINNETNSNADTSSLSKLSSVATTISKI